MYSKQLKDFTYGQIDVIQRSQTLKQNSMIIFFQVLLNPKQAGWGAFGAPSSCFALALFYFSKIVI